jgi:hypothetical protein
VVSGDWRPTGDGKTIVNSATGELRLTLNGLTVQEAARLASEEAARKAKERAAAEAATREANERSRQEYLRQQAAESAARVQAAQVNAAREAAEQEERDRINNAMQAHRKAVTAKLKQEFEAFDFDKSSIGGRLLDVRTRLRLGETITDSDVTDIAYYFNWARDNNPSVAHADVDRITAICAEWKMPPGLAPSGTGRRFRAIGPAEEFWWKQDPIAGQPLPTATK